MASAQLASSQYSGDGFVKHATRGSQARVELARPLPDLRDTVLIGGCAPGLSVLTDRLNGTRGPGRFRWLMQANPKALQSLSRGHTHIAGVHLAAEGAGQLSRSLARHLPTERAEVYALARWEAGLVVNKGNPKRISSIGDVASPKVRVALREPGSGARQHLERLLERDGCNIASLAKRSFEVTSHMDVAHAVAMGAADVGFTIRSAALAHDLSFVPLVEERFDLVITDDLCADARVLRLLDMVASRSFQRELDELRYDTRVSATKVCDVVA
jgi:molybdate-binding protein